MTEHTTNKIWRWVLIGMAALLSVVVIVLGTASFLLSTQSGSRWLIDNLVLRLNANPGLTFSVSEMRGTLFRGLTFSGTKFSNESIELSIESLSTSWNPYSLLSGNFYLSTVDSEGISARLLNSSEPTSENPVATDWDFTNPLPVGISVGSISADAISIDQNGQLYLLQHAAMSLQLEDQTLLLSDLQLDNSNAALHGNIQIELAEYLPLEAVLSWRYSGLLLDYFDNSRGEIKLQGNLQQMQLEHQLTSPYSIHSVGSITSGLVNDWLNFDLTHSSESLVLPFEAASVYDLSEIVIATKGNFSRLSLQVETIVSSSLLPEIAVNAGAIYEEQKLTIDRYRLSTSSGSVSGRAQMEFGETIRLSGDYSLLDQNPLIYFEQSFPTELRNLNGAGNFNLEVNNNNAQGDLVITELSGRLGNYPVQASGSIILENEILRFEQLQLSTTSNQISLNGSYADEWDVNWQISAPLLEEFVDGLKGELAGFGALRGSLTTPILQGQLAAQNLGIGDITIEVLSLMLEQDDKQINGSLHASNLVYAEDSSKIEVPIMQWSITGTQQAHQITWNVESGFGNMELTLLGGVSDLGAMAWKGNLSRAQIHGVLGEWNSQAAANLQFSPDSSLLENSCWTQNEAVLCLTIDRGKNQGSEILATLRDYSLEVLNSGSPFLAIGTFEFPQLSERIFLQGLVDGQLSASLTTDAETEVELQLQLRTKKGILSILPASNAEVTERVDDEQAETQIYILENNELSASLVAGQWDISTGTTFLRENIEDSEINLSGEVSSALSISVDRQLGGDIRAKLDDIRWLEAFLPQLSDIDGSIDGQASIAGSIDRPELTGMAQISDASLSIDRLGITLSDFNTEISSSRAGSSQFSGSVNSGAGTVNFTGSINDLFSTNRELSAQLNGQDFLLADITDLKLAVSPTVSLVANSAQVQVNGTLDLPVFELTLQQLPESAVDISRDVVITSYPSDRPELARSLSASDTTVFDIPISGDVNITLGEQVSFSGFGMHTKVDGDLHIQQSVNGSNLTYGELSILDGNYQMYGQTLDIRQGKFLFFGAYDNPAVDIRAVREVDNLTVGVLMNGTLKNISSQLFSTPALPDNDIISVLVTGRPFSRINSEDSDALLGAIANLGIDRGQGLTNQIRDKLGLDTLAVESTGNINNSVLTIGKYLTPEIFVRYGVGLFDSQPKVSVDYSITDRIKLQAESGEFQSVDITYSVEQ